MKYWKFLFSGVAVWARTQTNAPVAKQKTISHFRYRIFYLFTKKTAHWQPIKLIDIGGLIFEIFWSFTVFFNY